MPVVVSVNPSSSLASTEVAISASGILACPLWMVLIKSKECKGCRTDTRDKESMKPEGGLSSLTYGA